MDSSLQQITYSDFSDVGSVYNNLDIFILSGFTSGSPRFDLLGKYNKSTNKFSFSDILYIPDKHDTYLYIDPDEIPTAPREQKAYKSRLGSFGYHPRRGGGNIHENNTANRFEYNYINYIQIIIFKKV